MLGCRQAQPGRVPSCQARAGPRGPLQWGALVGGAHSPRSIVCKGLEDPSQVVRNAALFALGQFSENLQVSKADCGCPHFRVPTHPRDQLSFSFISSGIPAAIGA